MKYKDKYHHIRNNMSGTISLAELIVWITIMGICAAAILPQFSRLSKAAKEEKVSQPIPEPQPVNTEPINFPLGEIVLGLFGFIAVGILVYSIVFFAKFLKKKKSEHNENVAGWEALMSRYDDIITRWSSYEMDILKIIDYPMLTDMSAPTTVAFHQAMRHARMTAPKNKNYTGGYLESPFATAVTELEKAFEVAESTAKRSQWKMYDREEKKMLNRAKDMLALALDNAGTAHERQIAYRAAMKILNGLIDVPAMTLASIENKTKLALVA